MRSIALSPICRRYPERGRSTARMDAHQIREVLWASDALGEAFIVDNPASRPAADLAPVASWRERMAGRFFILRHLKKTLFSSPKSNRPRLGVLGLVSPVQ
jgi:hypothetical protein